MPSLPDHKVPKHCRLPSGYGLGYGLAAAALLTAGPLAAQDHSENSENQSLDERLADAPASSNSKAPQSDTVTLDFAADQIIYDEKAQKVSANGNVVLERDGYRLFADEVTWMRDTGEVRALGSVRIISPDGSVSYGENIELSDTLKDGIVENILLVLKDGGRLAAERGVRSGGLVILENAAYSPCRVVNDEGCPKNPTWQVRADRVTFDTEADRVKYKNARIELFGLPFVPLPGLAHAVNKESESGLLVPRIGYDRNNGFEFSQPYYFRLSDTQDLTFAGYAYSKVAPMVRANYRSLVSKGAFELDAYATYGTHVPLSGNISSKKGVRAYLAGSGSLEFDPHWSADASLRLTTDRTFADRYDITSDDRMRNTVGVQRVDENSYFEIRGWAVQTLRIDEKQSEVPFALPMIDYRLRLANPVAGGRVSLQANSLAVTRTSGQDTQRAFASARWDRAMIMNGGQRVTFTLFGRGDVYHSDENSQTTAVLYRGQSGWQTRAIATAAIDMEYPLVGNLWGGTQRLTPRVQIVASPDLKNISLPNEDARAIDLEDSNLFALNRFPGYDRYEDNARITYGVEWKFTASDWRIDANIGQSYRLSNNSTILPDGTGLSDRMSDIVGRVKVQWKDKVSFTHRFRLDKDNGAARRLEFDGTFGGRETYITVGYLRLDRDVFALEDLRNREEFRVGSRWKFSKNWSVFGSGIFDLTDAKEDPLSLSDGFEPIKTRLGIAYDDDCLSASFSWKREYEQRGDSRKGSSFSFQLSFHNLGV